MRFRVHILFAILCLSVANLAFSQSYSTSEATQAEYISKFVSNLSFKQKRQLDMISKENNKEVASLKSQLSVVRSDIRRIMDDKGDHTNEMMPLLEREAALELQINKALYRVKVKIDEVLTDEQYHELISKMEKNRHRCREASKK